MQSTMSCLFFVSLVTFAALSQGKQLKGLTCMDHPLYKPGFKGEIIRSWTYTKREEKKFYFSASGYIPRYEQHGWAPIEDHESKKYQNLDLFVSYMQRTGPDPYVTLHFQRKAKVYMFVSGYDKMRPTVRLSGWKSEGWVEMVKGDKGQRAKVGLMSKQDFPVPVNAYVFSKSAAIKAPLPSMPWVRDNLQGMSSNGYYHIMVAEADGSVVPAPIAPSGMNITAAQRCPSALHDTWMATGRDTEDVQTKSRKFRTYHPIWDPCFWCAYDHEHGSAAKKLMGYEPLYGYVALKNKNEDESHNGFKDFVLDMGRHRLYYSIHAHMSLPRRFFARFHTVVIVVADTKSQEKLVELSYKADFGFVSVKAAAGGSMPLTRADEILRERQQEKKETPGFREVNVIDPDNLDRRILYRHSGKDILKGEYERWMAHPMCASMRIRGPVADIKGAHNALRTTHSKGDDTVTLGRYLHGSFRPHVGVNRDLRFVRWSMGWEHCGLGDDMTKNGVFYTDAHGKKLMDGPGPNAVRQYIKPGFTATFEDGIYMVDDTWLGLHKLGVLGGMHDIMKAIDPKKN